MVYFRKLDVFLSTSDDWRLFHTFRRLFHNENEPDEPILDDKTTEVYIKRDMITSGMELSVYRIFDSNNVIGSFYYGIYNESSTSYLGNERVARFEIQLLKAYHQKSIATKALQIMVDDCEKRGKSVFISEFQNSYYKPFFEAIGGTIAQTNNESKLIISEVDESMIKSWISEAERENPDTKVLVFENKIPESMEVEYARTFNETLQQIPRGNIESRARVFDVDSLRTMEKANNLVGALSINVVSVEKDGLVSGITNVRRNQGSEHFLNQGLTGVLNIFRGEN